jgi:1-aminocyclopropane-1-carboxylate deaminase/D-cysteine desulfhydrase-like pyridoxal-dependent ACC family enzyme
MQFVNTTPLQPLDHLSSLLGVELRMKLDQYFPCFGGGSKARKFAEILHEIRRAGANAVVTAGSANSNHARVVALACAQYGWKCTIVIHDTEDYGKANLRLMKLTGANLVFVPMQEVADRMNHEMSVLVSSGYTPYYVYGGGHHPAGIRAFHEAVHEFSLQAETWSPDIVIVASGTGGTQAGLTVGFHELYARTQVIGISIARKREPGKKAVVDAISAYGIDHQRGSPDVTKIDFRDDWIEQGYGESCDAKVEETIRIVASTAGVILDPIYTGKAMNALFDLVERREIARDSRVLFWHTGTIENFLSSKVT